MSNLAEQFGQSARGLVRPGQRPRTRPEATPRPPADPSSPAESDAGEVEPQREATPSPADTTTADTSAAGPTTANSEQEGSSGETAASPDVNPGPVPAMATVQSIVYVAPAVRDALDVVRKRDRRTNAELVFDALDRTQHQLPELVARQHRQERPVNSLFATRQSRTRQRATTPAERTVPFSYRATAAELSVIDQLVTTAGAASRSALIAVALEAVFARGNRRRR